MSVTFWSDPQKGSKGGLKDKKWKKQRLFHAAGKYCRRRIALIILVSHKRPWRSNSRNIWPVMQSAPGAISTLRWSMTKVTDLGEKRWFRKRWARNFIGWEILLQLRSIQLNFLFVSADPSTIDFKRWQRLNWCSTKIPSYSPERVVCVRRWS